MTFQHRRAEQTKRLDGFIVWAPPARYWHYSSWWLSKKIVMVRKFYEKKSFFVQHGYCCWALAIFTRFWRARPCICQRVRVCVSIIRENIQQNKDTPLYAYSDRRQNTFTICSLCVCVCVQHRVLFDFQLSKISTVDNDYYSTHTPASAYSLARDIYTDGHTYIGTRASSYRSIYFIDHTIDENYLRMLRGAHIV